MTQTFTGKELDLFDKDHPDGEDGEGWYYFGARYYDPEIALWISVDKEAHRFGGLSPYNYCLNNPINSTDPDGNAPDPVTFGVTWVVAMQSMYDVEMTSMAAGDPYWTTVGLGLTAYASNLVTGLIGIPKLGAISNSTVTSAINNGTVEIAKQMIKGEKLNMNKVSAEAGKGALTGAVGSILGKGVEHYNPDAGMVTAAVGSFVADKMAKPNQQTTTDIKKK